MNKIICKRCKHVLIVLGCNRAGAKPYFYKRLECDLKAGKNAGNRCTCNKFESDIEQLKINE